MTVRCTLMYMVKDDGTAVPPSSKSQNYSIGGPTGFQIVNGLGNNSILDGNNAVATFEFQIKGGVNPPTGDPVILGMDFIGVTVMYGDQAFAPAWDGASLSVSTSLDTTSDKWINTAIGQVAFQWQAVARVFYIDWTNAGPPNGNGTAHVDYPFSVTATKVNDQTFQLSQ